MLIFAIVTNNIYKYYNIMASLRILKKEIDYRLEEFVFDCEMAIYFQPSKEEAVVALMEKAVDLRNMLYFKANNPRSSTRLSVVIWYLHSQAFSTS